MYVEIAIGSPSKRGTLVPLEELWDMVYEHGANQAVFRSVYMYNEEAVDFVKRSGSIKNFLGTRYADEIPIDIDKGQNTDEYTLQQAQAVVRYLEDAMDLKDGNFQCYYSGTGYHICISEMCFGFEASPDLPYIVKETIANFDIDVVFDASVYSRTALIRLPHTMNVKSQLFKIPLTRVEIMSLKVEEIQKLASNRRLDFGIAELWGEGNLTVRKEDYNW